MAVIVETHRNGGTYISIERFIGGLNVPRHIHLADTPQGHKWALRLGSLGLIRHHTIIIEPHDPPHRTIT